MNSRKILKSPHIWLTEKFWKIHTANSQSFGMQTFPFQYLKFLSKVLLNFLLYQTPLTNLIFWYFQALKNLGIIREEEKLGWLVDTDESKRFRITFDRKYKYWKDKVRKQKERAHTEVAKAKIAKLELPLHEPFLCPTKWPAILRRFVHKRPRTVQQTT